MKLFISSIAFLLPALAFAGGTQHWSCKVNKTATDALVNAMAAKPTDETVDQVEESSVTAFDLKIENGKVTDDSSIVVADAATKMGDMSLTDGALEASKVKEGNNVLVVDLSASGHDNYSWTFTLNKSNNTATVYENTFIDCLGTYDGYAVYDCSVE